MGTTSRGENGVVGVVGHRRSSTAHSFVKMHSITWCIVDVFAGVSSSSSKLCVYCKRVFVGSMVSLELWDNVGVPLGIHL